MSKLPFHTIYNLIGKRLSKQAKKHESEQLNEWLEATVDAKDTYTEIEKIWSNVHFSHENPKLISQDEVSEEIWNSAFNGENKKKRKKIDGSLLIKIAAIFIIFFTATFVVFYVVDSTPREAIQITTISKKTLPGHKSTITLQDGTIIYLNSGSKISYKSNFNDSLRIIDLEGEAFVEVFKDKSKPFVVRCKNLEIEALGTSFDINGYKNAPTFVSLLTGSVKISYPSENEDKQLILNPGEYSKVNEDGTISDKGIFDPYEVLAWKEGRLIFKNETISEIVPKLELWFGVHILDYSTVDQSRPFNSTFKKENLENILMNIGQVLNFDYEIKGNNVYINKKELPM